ncbi:hypothetical protein DFJ77DRAFT_157450 [Powellomyces hirtus]|nr:hypothetical protein DFJ77DRAFT_157450 [Powellomyces hirtus]
MQLTSLLLALPMLIATAVQGATIHANLDVGMVNRALDKGLTHIDVRVTCRRKSDWTHNNAIPVALVRGQGNYILVTPRCKKENKAKGRKLGLASSYHLEFKGKGKKTRACSETSFGLSSKQKNTEYGANPTHGLGPNYNQCRKV